MPSQHADAKVTVGSDAAANERRSSQPSDSGDAQSKLGRIATVQQSIAPEDEAVELLKGEAKSAKVHPIIATEATENDMCAGTHARVQALPACEETQSVEAYDQQSVEAHVRSIEAQWEEDWKNNPREEFHDKMLDRLEEDGALHSLIIPPKDSDSKCRDWNSKSQQRWVCFVLLFTFSQVLLTWLLFYMSIYN